MKKNKLKILVAIITIVVMYLMIYLCLTVLSNFMVKDSTAILLNEIEQRDITIENGRYDAVNVTIWYLNSQGRWSIADRVHLPGGSVYKIHIGNGLYSSYGYSIGEGSIHRFYSNRQIIY